MTLPIRNSRIRLSQGQVFWHEVGYGRALVFLHGSWSGSSEWLPIIEQLGTEYHCSALDLLGFGESDQPKIHYSVEVEVECLAEYLDSLKLKRVYLIGHGIGGWVAASYALRCPDQVEGLVLLGAEGVLSQAGERWRREQWLTRLSLLGWVLRSLAPLLRFLGQKEPLADLLALQQTLRRSPAACQLLFNRRHAEIRAELLHDRIEWLKLPILILQGEQDAPTVVALNQAYGKAPHATLRFLPGKNLIQANPEAVAGEISAFVEQIMSTDKPR